MDLPGVWRTERPVSVAEAVRRVVLGIAFNLVVILPTTVTVAVLTRSTGWAVGALLVSLPLAFWFNMRVQKRLGLWDPSELTGERSR